MQSDLWIWVSFASFAALFLGLIVHSNWPRPREKQPNPFAHLNHMADLSGLKDGSINPRSSGIFHDRPRISPDGPGNSGDSGGFDGGGAGGE